MTFCTFDDVARPKTFNIALLPLSPPGTMTQRWNELLDGNTA